MKALWRFHTGTQSFCDTDEPEIRQPDDVKIRVTYNTIGIQDMRMAREWDFYAKAGIAGYEMAGIIEELGEEAKSHGLYAGQRVSGTIVEFCGKCFYCNRHQENLCLSPKIHSGTLCEFVIWKWHQVIPLPDSMSYRIGTLTEPVAVVAMAADKMRIQKGDNICIFGGDFNGLVLLQMAKRLGAGSVTVIEGKKYNRELAVKMGADVVIEPADDIYVTQLLKNTDFIGYQSVAVTSSHPEWIQAAVNVTAPGGNLIFTLYFDYGKDIAVNSIKLFRSSINISSSILYTREVLHSSIEWMGNLSLECLITKEYSFSSALEAFEEESSNLYPRIGIVGI